MAIDTRPRGARGAARRSKSDNILSHSEIPIPRVWKISAAWGNKRLDCTPEGIKRCGGCCKLTFKDNPKGCAYMGPKGCVLPPSRRLIYCLLYPMILNCNGTVVLHNWALFCCCKANYRKGPPIIVALRPCLIGLFGEKETDRIIADVTAGRNSFVVPPDSVILAFEHVRTLPWDQWPTPEDIEKFARTF